MLDGDAGGDLRERRREPAKERGGGRRPEHLRHDKARHVGRANACEGVGRRASVTAGLAKEVEAVNQ